MKSSYESPYPLSDSNRPEWMPGNASDNVREILGVTPGITRDELLKQCSNGGVKVREVAGSGGQVLCSDRLLSDMDRVSKVFYIFYNNRLMSCTVFMDAEETGPYAASLMDRMTSLRDLLSERLGYYEIQGRDRLKGARKLEGIINGENVYASGWEYDKYSVWLVPGGKKWVDESLVGSLADSGTFMFLRFEYIPTGMEKRVMEKRSR